MQEEIKKPEQTAPQPQQANISVEDLIFMIGQKEVRINFLAAQLNKASQEVAKCKEELEALKVKQTKEE